MRNRIVDIFYNNTYDIIKDKLGADTIYEEAYKQYLSEKFKSFIRILDPEDNSEQFHSFIMHYVENEKKYLNKLTKDQMLSILIEDTAFEKIKRCSKLLFEEAKICSKTKEYLNDEEEYNKRIEYITHLLDEVKPYNLESAKVLVSEAILDANLIYKKNDNLMSLRMAAIKN